MVKTIISISLIILGIAALGGSTSRTAMDALAQARAADAWWGRYRAKHGNLVAMAYLDYVHKFHEPQQPHRYRKPATAPNTVLYLAGDSYTWSLPDTCFAAGEYHFINRYAGGTYKLDSTKTNILVIEITEIAVRGYFSSDRLINDLRKNDQELAAEQPATHPHHAAIGNIDFSELFNNRINQNLAFNLFNYQCVAPMYQSKALLNYYLFHRASGDVVLSHDGNYLFEKSNLISPSDTMQPQELDIVIGNLNKIYRHFRSTGFNEVYLALIPATPAIVQPHDYNNLIPAVQYHPRLEMNIIDAHRLLRSSPQYFCHGDTHWNNEGEQKWLDLLNEMLHRNQ